MPKEVLSILDKRTQATYEIPIHNGTIRAMDLRQDQDRARRFRAHDLRSRLHEHGVVPKRDHLHRRRQRHPALPGLPHRATGGEMHFPGGRLSDPVRGTADRAQLKEWVGEITHHTMLHETTKKFLEGFRYNAHPMGMLVSTVAALSTVYPEARNVHDPEVRKLQIMRLIGKMPTIAAYTYRHSLGYPYVYPDNDLSYTENFMNMLWKMVEPKYAANPIMARALDILFILHADHEQNCSANVMRAVGSSHADPFLATAAAAAALSGPLHGGANEEVLKMLDEIGSKDRVPAYIEKVKAGELKLMGFGHRIYKNYDPRARIIKWAADKVFEVTGQNPKLEIALELERIALDDEYFIKRKLYPNVDFYSGIIYQAMGFKPEMFTVLFAIPRTAGWLAQWQEMLADSDQKIARPRQIYTGSAEREFVPLEKRGITATPTHP